MLVSMLPTNVITCWQCVTSLFGLHIKRAYEKDSGAQWNWLGFEAVATSKWSISIESEPKSIFWVWVPTQHMIIQLFKVTAVWSWKLAWSKSNHHKVSTIYISKGVWKNKNWFNYSVWPIINNYASICIFSLSLVMILVIPPFFSY